MEAVGFQEKLFTFSMEIMDKAFKDDQLIKVGEVLSKRSELENIELDISECSSLTDAGFIAFLD